MSTDIDTQHPAQRTKASILVDLERVARRFWEPLNDDTVTEISANPDGQIFVTRFGTRPAVFGTISALDADIFTRWCASTLGLCVTETNPIVSGRLPGTLHRIEMIVPPVVEAASFSIRRHSSAIRPLETFGVDADLRFALRKAMAERANIIISGGVQCGKTTFQAALLAELNDLQPDTRVVILEDTPELTSQFTNSLSLLGSPTMSLDRLLVSTLRLAPDRIIVGEVRTGAVALTMLKAWNTGHPGGLSTIHANSGADVFNRFDELIAEVSVNAQSKLVARTADIIIQLGRPSGRPSVIEIIDYRQNKEGTYLYERQS